MTSLSGPGWRWFAAWCAGWVLCVIGGGLLRQSGDPVQYPLFDSSRSMPLPVGTYNPGRQSFRSLLVWSSLNDGDFRPVYDAAQRVQDGQPLYRPEELREGRASFVYTPFTAWLVSPFVRAGWSAERTAEAVSLVNHVLAILGWVLLYRLVLAGRERSWLHLVWFALPVLAYYPMASALYLTQCGVWIFFLSSLSFALFSRGLALPAGLALGLAASIKPHLAAVPVALLFFPGFPRRFVAGTLAAGLATLGLSLAYVGWDTLVGYLTETLPQLSSGYSYFRNQSFNGLLLRGFTEQRGVVFDLAEPVPWIRATASALGLALVVGVVLASRRSPRVRVPEGGSERSARGQALDDLLAFALVFASVVVASPVCWIHHLILLAFPIGIGVRALLARRAAGVPSLAASWALLLGALLCGFLFDARGVPSGWPSWKSNLELYGALLVIATLVVLRRQRASGTPREASA